MIVHRSSKAKLVTPRAVDTRGMTPKVARATREREAGLTAAKTGAHQGGPCPAVCIATLTGWSYGDAARWLKERYGYRGAGIQVELMDAAMRELFGRERIRQVHTAGSCRATVQRRFQGKSGYVRCRGHVMPVVDGRLLNAGGFEDLDCVAAYEIEK